MFLILHISLIILIYISNAFKIWPFVYNLGNLCP